MHAFNLNLTAALWNHKSAKANVRKQQNHSDSDDKDIASTVGKKY